VAFLSSFLTIKGNGKQLIFRNTDTHCFTPTFRLPLINILLHVLALFVGIRISKK